VPGRYRLLADITPLRESAAFRRLWAGTTLSSVGSALTAFAVMLQVYEITRSPFAVGAIGVAQMVPTLAVGLLGGPVTDADGAVLDRAGVPVAGLYAAGRSAVGLCSRSYVSGLSIADCVFSGRRAGRHAAGLPRGATPGPPAAAR